MKKIIFAILALLTISSAAVIAARYTQNISADPDAVAKVGDQCPSFTVQMLDGDEISIDSLRGKTVLINFWATWCPPCREELKYVQKDIVDRFAGQDFAFVAVSRGETRAKVEAFVKGGYENFNNSDIFGYEDDLWFIPSDNSLCPRYWYVGGGVHYFPLRDSRDLRLHAVAAYNNFAKSVSITLGATYHFNLTQTILKNRK